MTGDEYSPDFSGDVEGLFETLRHPLRREIIFYFESHATSSTTSFEQVITYLAEQAGSYTRDRLRLVLPHTHLPKLESRGWLEYDRDANEITYHGHDEAAQLLRETYEVFTS